MIDEKKLIEDLEKAKSNCKHLHELLFFDGVMAIVDNQPKINQWIPCSERLPEKYGTYLVAWRPLNVTQEQIKVRTNSNVTHYYEMLEFDPDEDSQWIEIIEQSEKEYKIIAWQPLPSPYQP